MSLFPKYLLQHIGLLSGYFFNFLIAGIAIKIAYQSSTEQDWTGVFFSSIIAISVLLWTFNIIRKSYKELKSKQKKISQ